MICNYNHQQYILIAWLLHGLKVNPLAEFACEQTDEAFSKIKGE
ncbi:hypothetical protein FDUTEX481_07186 [Tolypothrix sp. PCC 7601]|nr:hypothetical protein FDUTEX481_07186 [Tolypothrix sp. PCC 7601]